MSYNVLDLFCGMGGWSVGFYRMGFDCYGLDKYDLEYPSAARAIKAQLVEVVT